MFKKLLTLIVLSVSLSTYAASGVAVEEIKIITFGDSLTAGLIRDSSDNISCPAGVSLEPGRFGSEPTPSPPTDPTDPDEPVEPVEPVEPDEPRNGCYGNGALNVGGYQTKLADSISVMEFVPQIVNFGFSGISTAEMLSARGTVLSSLTGAEYVLILAGANDAVAGISQSTVVSNLTVIVNDVRSRGMIPIITTTTRNTREPILDLRTDRYAREIRDYASANEVLLADARAAMVPDWDDFHSGDGLHLGDLGNETLASLYFQALDLESRLTDDNINFIPAIFLLLLEE